MGARTYHDVHIFKETADYCPVAFVTFADQPFACPKRWICLFSNLLEWDGTPSFAARLTNVGGMCRRRESFKEWL